MDGRRRGLENDPYPLVSLCQFIRLLVLGEREREREMTPTGCVLRLITYTHVHKLYNPTDIYRNMMHT